MNPRDNTRAWITLAACGQPGVDPEIFFPHDGDKHTIEEAKAVCRACPVTSECLRDALADEGGARYAHRHGIRGTYTPGERLAVYRKYVLPKIAGNEEQKRSKNRRNLGPVTCGTRRGYQKHRRNGEEACEACKRANTDADNRLRRTGTTKAAAA